MGAPGTELAQQVAFLYTATSSRFIFEVDNKIKMNVTFLSPIAPNNFKRQSLVFSYLDVRVWSIDGQYHNVQVYSDISAGTS